MRTRLEEIVASLRAEGFVFVAKEPLGPQVAPRALSAGLKKIEARVGPVPLALARFWANVGSVDLRGNHPRWPRRTYRERAEDEPVAYADPLVIVSMKGAIDDALDSEFARDPALPDTHYALEVSGDDVTKANFSGGVVSVRCAPGVIDPVLEPLGETLLSSLRRSLAAGGFPGPHA
jgi:hypothetical protein